jgi:hypothetical protein
MRNSIDIYSDCGSRQTTDQYYELTHEYQFEKTSLGKTHLRSEVIWPRASPKFLDPSNTVPLEKRDFEDKLEKPEFQFCYIQLHNSGEY